jgi:predicted MFS family arabinose efflux permease
MQITNQSEIYRLHPEARSRITTGYMVAYFVGGALGSLVSAQGYDAAGWGGVCALGAAVSAVSVAAWLLEQRKGGAARGGVAVRRPR